MSHTILHGLWRGFLSLIISANGLVVEGKMFRLSPALLRRFDKIIDAVHLTRSFNKSAKKLLECVPFSRVAQFVNQWRILRGLTSVHGLHMQGACVAVVL